jgi:hypothetical protein
MGSAVIHLDVTDERGQHCKVQLEWAGTQSDLDRLVSDMDRTSYAKGVAPEHSSFRASLDMV